MRREVFAEGRVALAFGDQKLNLHQAGHEHEPKAASPTPGSADLCLITIAEPEETLRHLQECGAAVVEGPVRKTGALGPIGSVYLRDRDGNLIEVAHYPNRYPEAPGNNAGVR